MTTEAPVATIPAGPSPTGPAAPPAAGGTPAAPAPGPKSTVETLFPDFIGPDGHLMEKPNVSLGREPGDVFDPTPATDKGGQQPPAPTPPAPGAPQYLDLSSLEGKMVKLKVDGVEIDVPASSLAKNYQLEAHLTQKGQRLADQEKILQDVLKEAINRPPTGTPPAAGATPPNSDAPSDIPEVAKVQAELKKTQAELAQVTAATAHIRVEQGLKAIDADIRRTTGADDFMTYAPKIQDLARSLCKDPKNPTPQEVAAFDSVAFYRATYSEMKLKDMIAGKPATPPPAAPPAGQPPQPGVERRPAPSVSVVDGAGSPAIDRTGSDWNGRYKAALQKATTTGDLNDWAEVNRLKNEPLGSR